MIKWYFLGHSTEIIGQIYTAHGYISAQEANEKLYDAYLTATKGEITDMSCDEDGLYQFEMKGIAWQGMSGSIILLAQDTSKFCGVFSRVLII